MPRIEVTSTGSEAAYYASLEVRGLPRSADLAKTLRFKKPPPIPQPDPATTRFERCDPVTTPFLKESAPYELIDIQDGPAEIVQDQGVEVVDIDLESMELIAASDLLAGDTIRSAGPIFEQPRSSTSLRWMVIGLVLTVAFAAGIALAYLALS